MHAARSVRGRELPHGVSDVHSHTHHRHPQLWGLAAGHHNASSDGVADDYAAVGNDVGRCLGMASEKRQGFLISLGKFFLSLLKFEHSAAIR